MNFVLRARANNNGRNPVVEQLREAARGDREEDVQQHRGPAAGDLVQRQGLGRRQAEAPELRRADGREGLHREAGAPARRVVPARAQGSHDQRIAARAAYAETRHGPPHRPAPERPRQERGQPRALPAPLQDAHPASGARRWSASASSRTWSRAATCACRARTSPSPRSTTAAAATASTSSPATASSSPGDRIPRPRRRRRRRRQRGDRAAKATAQDDFVFSLSREEFMQIFFDDLELPRLARTEFGPSNVQEHPRRLRQDWRAGQPRRRAHA